MHVGDGKGIGVCFESAVEEIGPGGEGFVREGAFEGDEVVPLLLFVYEVVVPVPLVPKGAESGGEVGSEPEVGDAVISGKYC